MMEEKKINFFAIPVFSFVPPKYKKLIKEKPGKVFGILLICFLVMYLITAIVATFTIDRVGDVISSECPDFSLANGTFSCEKPLYVNEDGFIFVIDSSIDEVSAEDVQELVDSSDEFVQGAFVAGSKSMVIYQPGQGYQSIKYSDLDSVFGGEVYLTKDSVIGSLLPIVKGFMVVVMLFAAFFAIGWHYFVCLILQLLTYIGESIFKHPLDGTERYRTTVLARFPVVFIAWFAEIFGISIPLILRIAITAVFALLAVYYMNKKDEEELVPQQSLYTGTPVDSFTNETYNAPQDNAYVVNNSNEPKAIDFFGTTNPDQNMSNNQNPVDEQNPVDDQNSNDNI